MPATKKMFTRVSNRWILFRFSVTGFGTFSPCLNIMVNLVGPRSDAENDQTLINNFFRVQSQSF